MKLTLSHRKSSLLKGNLLYPNKKGERRSNILSFNSQKQLVLSQSRDGFPIAGTLQRLVDLLLQDYLSKYAYTFVHTILDLVTVEQLLMTMTDCLVFYVSQVDGNRTVKLKIHRLISTLKLMIRAFPSQFQDENIFQLIHSLLRLCEPYFGTEYCDNVLECIASTELLLEPCSVHVVSFASDYASGILSHGLPVVAMQMTAIDRYYFESITANEWLDIKRMPSFDTPRLSRTTSMWSLSSSTLHSTSTTVWESTGLEKLTERFNLVGQWVASLICCAGNVERAATLIENMIGLANELYLLNNFHSSLAVITALSNPSVLRLKDTWKLVSTACKDILKNLEALFDPVRNFMRYREKLKSVTSAVPLLMLVCKDIYQIKVTQPKFQELGLLNFDRSKMLYDVLAPIMRFQQQVSAIKDQRVCDPRTAQKSDLFLELFHLRVIEAHSLYVKSLSIEK
jgi:stress-induced morphogen